MWPTWWWPQAFMQPEMLIVNWPIFCSSSKSVNARLMSCAIGIERAFASAQKSKPGQQMMSDRRPKFGVASSSARELLPQLVQLGLLDVDEHEVLPVGHANLAEAVAIGEIGHGVHLVGRDVARHLARRLQ